MKFKSPESEEEFSRCHPSLRAALTLFDDWSKDRGIPEPLITDIQDDGTAGRSPASWHMPHRLCAADLRTSHYTETQLEAVIAWLMKRFARPMWELKTELHGTGPHIHLARRDHGFTPRTKEQHYGNEPPVVRPPL